MKLNKYLIVTFLLIIVNFIQPFAQTPNFQWAVRSGGTGYDAAYDITLDILGNMIVTGYFDSTAIFGTTALTSAGVYDIFIAKYDSTGRALWARQGSGTGYDQGYSVTVDNAGSIIVTGIFTQRVTFGTTTITGTGGYDIFIAKFTPNGNLLWAKSAGGQSNDWSYSITTDELNNIYITGTFQGFASFDLISVIGGGFTDTYLAKYSPQGEALWVRNTSGASFSVSEGNSVAVNSNNDIFVAGSFTDSVAFIGLTTLSSRGSQDIFLAKYDTGGKLLWVKQAGGPAYDIPNDLKIDNEDNLFFTGTFGDQSLFGNINLTSIGFSDIFFAKYNPLGDPIWVKQEGVTEINYYGVGISLDGINNISILGKFYNSEENTNIYLARYDGVGDKIWDVIIETNTYSNTNISGISSNSIGDIYLAETFSDSISLGILRLDGYGQGDVFITKIPAPRITLNPGIIDFGRILSGKNITRNLVIENISNAVLHINNISIIGKDVQDFSIGSSILPDSILPLQTFNLNLNFSPLSIGNKTAFLIVESDANSTPDSATLIGAASISSIVYSQDTLDFGGVRMGESLTLALNIFNNSDFTVYINQVSILGLDANSFSIITGGQPDSVLPQQSKDVNVRFTPIDFESKLAYLVIESSAATSPDTIYLKGQGIVGMPDYTFSPDTLNFGIVDVGNLAELIFTITRTLPADLIINDFIFSGTDSGEFTVVNQLLPDTVPALGSKNYSIRFTPVAAGIKNVILYISSSALSIADSIVLVGNAISLINVKLPDSTNIGQNTSINITPPASFEFITSQFFYRMTGEQNYQQTNLILSDSFYIADIPAAYSTIRGIQFYVVFSDGINTVTYPSNDPVNNPASIQISMLQYEYPNNFSPSSYIMVSIPLQVSNPQINSILFDDYGIYDNKVWRFFRWQQSSGNYIEYPNLEDVFFPGNAFWLIERDGRNFDVDNASSILSLNDFSITLQPGWNQIGNPFAFPINWNNIQNSSLVEPPIRWNQDMQDYEINQQILQPWEGYWIYDSLDQVIILSVPPIASDSIIDKKNVQTNLDMGEFIIQIKAYLEGSNIRDQQNFVGMLKDAKDYSDKYDFLKPPPVTDNLRLSTISNSKEYAQNMAAVSSEGAFWDLKLSSALMNINIALQIDNLSSLPKDFNIWLLDKNRQIAIPLVDNKFIINMNEEVKVLKLITGTEKYANQNAENISLVPFEYALYQNYPNPFNPVTNISYYLREKSNVSVFIYDILGREIKSLITNEFQNAGEHFIVWDGTNTLNNRAASGIYIYKIIANDFIDSKKMILLK